MPLFRALVAPLAFALLGVLLFAQSPAFAQSERVCPGLKLENPAERIVATLGSHAFSWLAEPKGTASREFVLLDLAGDHSVREASAPLEHRVHVRHGTYSWFVIFYDNGGSILCTSPVGTLLADRAAAAPLDAGKASVRVVVDRKFVVVIIGNSGGTSQLPNGVKANLKVTDGDDFDFAASGIKLRRYSGLTIYGNGNANIIHGSGKADIIFGFAGNDTLYGEAGDDEIYGGDEHCDGYLCVQLADGHLGDTIDGGEGNDIIDGGDESCTNPDTFNPNFFGCNRAGRVGDIIVAGAGDDTIHGGDETCAGDVCNYGAQLGDLISGGSGKDTIAGGNETCSYNTQSCNYLGQVGDTIDGGDDDDQISGGTQKCLGGVCNVSGVVGNVIKGGNGNDILNGGDSDCDGPCDWGTNGNTIDGEGGDDTITGGVGLDHMTGGPGNDTIDGVSSPDAADPVAQ